MTILKVILFIVGGVVALGGLMAAIGAALPRDHRSTRAAVVAGTPAEVHAVLADVASAPGWRRGVTRVEPLAAGADGKFRFVEHASYGTVPFVVDEDEPGRRRVTRIADDRLPFGGRWIYELAPEAGQTRVTITEEGEVKNPLFRFLSRFVFGHATSLERYLAELRGRMASPPPRA